MRKMREDKIRNVIKVARFLIENSNGSYILQISKELKMPVGTVANALSFLSVFLEREAIADKIDMPLPKLPVIYRIKQGITLDAVVKLVQLKQQIKGNEREA